MVGRAVGKGGFGDAPSAAGLSLQSQSCLSCIVHPQLPQWTQEFSEFCVSCTEGCSHPAQCE